MVVNDSNQQKTNPKIAPFVWISLKDTLRLHNGRPKAAKAATGERNFSDNSSPSLPNLSSCPWHQITRGQLSRFGVRVDQRRITTWLDHKSIWFKIDPHVEGIEGGNSGDLLNR